VFPDLESKLKFLKKTIVKNSFSLAFLKRFPKLRAFFDKTTIKNCFEEESLEETRSDDLTNTSNIMGKQMKTKLSVGKNLDSQENETNMSFFSEENTKNDSLTVLKMMWEKIFEHFGA